MNKKDNRKTAAGRQWNAAQKHRATAAWTQLTFRPGHSPHSAASQASCRFVSTGLHLAASSRHNCAIPQTLVAILAHIKHVRVVRTGGKKK
jgi:hypothetical protein